MPKKTLFLVFVIMCSVSSIYAQKMFNCIVQNYNKKTLTLCSHFSGESKIMSKITTSDRGSFSFSLDTFKIGLYRIYFENDDYFDFIFNNEKISLVTNFEDPVYNMLVIESNENKQFYTSLKANYETDYKTEIIEQLLDVYPEGNFTVEAKKEYAYLQTEKSVNLQNAINQNPNSFAGKYLACFKDFIIPSDISDSEIPNYINKNYWKNYNINDTILINSDGYNHIVIEYIKLKIRNYQTEDGYYFAAKDILDHCRIGNKKIFNFIFEYILEGFENIELYDQIYKLSLEYGELCENDVTDDSNLKLRIKSYTELANGKIAPDFETTTLTKTTVKLSKNKQKYTLLIFWATWCEHCQAMIPEFERKKEIFNTHNIRVLTVSLDKYSENITNFISNNNISFPVICDLKSWDNEIVKKYFIFGTPTMFLIDNDMKIIARPYNSKNLFKTIEKLN